MTTENQTPDNTEEESMEEPQDSDTNMSTEVETSDDEEELTADKSSEVDTHVKYCKVPDGHSQKCDCCPEGNLYY